MKLAHLNGLRAFEVTLRSGNFRAAAAELGVTPAAVGQRVRALEDYLGRKLFIRSRQGVTPTSDATLVEKELRGGFVALENVLGNLQSLPLVQGLKLTIDRPLYECWLAGRMVEFNAENPKIKLDVDISSRMVDLLADDFDFAVRFAPEQPTEYDNITLFPAGYIPICTADFARRYDLQKHPTSLKGVPLFHIHEETADPNWINWQGWCENHGVEYGGDQDGMRFTRHSFGYQAARSGLGLALCGLTESFHGFREGAVIMPFARNFSTACAFKFRLVWVRGRRQTDSHRRFRDWLTKCAADFRAEASVMLP